ncbi:hypothetical protein [Granulosicoccus sp. 3-233]|uniref:hypothetical protein n=1 Tax=Granulosicoccus sp. 3-233 TaxID=3417969 RepID=UPI003D328FDC
MNTKTPLFLAIATVLAGNLVACQSDNESFADPTAPGADPITGLPLEEASPAVVQLDDGSSVPAAASSGEVAMLSPSNYDSVVDEVFAVFTGAAYGSEVLALPPYPGFRALEIGGDYNDSSTSISEVCDNGGSANISLSWSGSRVILNDRQAFFDNCQYDTLVLDGEFQTLEYDNISVVSSGLTITGEGSTKSFSGGVGYGDGNNYGGSSERWWGASELNWSVSSEDQIEFAISNANTSYRIDGGFAHNMSGGFTLTTEDYIVQVQTVEALQSDRLDYDDLNYSPRNWFYSSGILRITASDGSSVLIEADNGDATSARVTLAYDGQLESFDKPWSDWDSVLRAGPSPAR